MVEATKPVNVPVRPVVAPDPTAGEEQRRVLPLPVHVPAAPVEAASVDTAEAEDVAWKLC